MRNPPTKYLFIDGHYLLCRLRDLANLVSYVGKPHEMLDFRGMLSDHERAFWFDSYPAKGIGNYSAKRAEKEQIFERINLTRNFRVVHGLSRYSGEKEGQRQKGVDVLLAITAYQHAIRGNMDIATIVAGDLDFLPLFEALSETRVRTKLVFYYKTPQRSLVEASDEIEMLTPFSILPWLTQDLRDGWQVSSGGGLVTSQVTDVQYASVGDQKVSVGFEQQTNLYNAFVEGKDGYARSKIKEVAASYFLKYPHTKIMFETR